VEYMGKNIKDLSVPELIEWYQETNEEYNKNMLFNQIYNKFSKYLNKMSKKFSIKYGVPKDDINQEAMITLYKCINHYDFNNKFVTYFKTALFNNVGNLIKKHIKYSNRNITLSPHDLEQWSDEKNVLISRYNEKPDDLYELELDIVLKNVKASHRELLENKYMLEMTFDEIAYLKGTTRQAIQQMCERIMIKVRGEIKE